MTKTVTCAELTEKDFSGFFDEIWCALATRNFLESHRRVRCNVSHNIRQWLEPISGIFWTP